MIIMCLNERVEEHLLKSMSKKFQVKTSSPSLFLGWVIDIAPDHSQVSLSQEHYVKQILIRFGMNDSKAMSTPIEMNGNLNKDVEHVSELDNTQAQQYMAIVGALNWISSGTRPDIAYTVNVLARHVAKPTTQHMKMAKRCLRYLKGTAHYSLHYHNNEQLYDGLTLDSFADASYATSEDSKSTNGFIIRVNNNVIDWKTSKQKITALSTTEAEFVAAALCASNILHKRQLLEQLGYKQDEPTKLFEDNQGAIALARNPVNQGRARHIDVKWNFLRDCVRNKTIELHYVSTSDQIADMFTKGLPAESLRTFTRMIGLY
jgi:hypothetical protein